jgi:hypothetical protein
MHNKVTDAYATEVTETGMCDLHEEAYDYSIKTVVPLYRVNGKGMTVPN